MGDVVIAIVASLAAIAIRVLLGVSVGYVAGWAMAVDQGVMVAVGVVVALNGEFLGQIMAKFRRLMLAGSNDS